MKTEKEQAIRADVTAMRNLEVPLRFGMSTIFIDSPEVVGVVRKYRRDILTSGAWKFRKDKTGIYAHVGSVLSRKLAKKSEKAWQERFSK